jgi:hypothetical protein
VLGQLGHRRLQLGGGRLRPGSSGGPPCDGGPAPSSSGSGCVVVGPAPAPPGSVVEAVALLPPSSSRSCVAPATTPATRSAARPAATATAGRRRWPGGSETPPVPASGPRPGDPSGGTEVTATTLTPVPAPLRPGPPFPLAVARVLVVRGRVGRNGGASARPHLSRPGWSAPASRARRVPAPTR